MTDRILGRTGLRVSSLTLGAMMFGGRTGPEESHQIIDRAIAAGINLIDTANVYNQGRSEELVGDALRRNGH
ncbi:MAG TPA: aldo/keto reductase, partial [Polyangiaceae bacterium]